MLNRRNFLRGSVGMAVGLCTLGALLESAAGAETAWIIGPQPGFTPEIGTLTSMLAFTRRQVEHNVKGLSQQDLDYLLDGNANTIVVKKKWDIPMNLGEPARKAIKGNSLDYYLDALHQAREKSLAEFRQRDDNDIRFLA
jgi:hypothetical protein